MSRTEQTRSASDPHSHHQSLDAVARRRETQVECREISAAGAHPPPKSSSRVMIVTLAITSGPARKGNREAGTRVEEYALQTPAVPGLPCNAFAPARAPRLRPWLPHCLTLKEPCVGQQLAHLSLPIRSGVVRLDLFRGRDPGEAHCGGERQDRHKHNTVATCPARQGMRWEWCAARQAAVRDPHSVPAHACHAGWPGR